MVSDACASTLMPDRATCIDQIGRRDPDADGRFWYSVVTTGVYCRPTCPSRRARPDNIRIHATLDEARATGFRPCLRCRPDGPGLRERQSMIVARACAHIEASETDIPLETLARAMGLSPSHFHRLFRAVTGVTPKDYAFACRAARVRKALARDGAVTSIFYDAGFGSSGRFYEKAGAMLGMTPTQFRSGGACEIIRFAVGQSMLGAILVASSERGVVAILLGDDPAVLLADLQDRFPHADLIGADPDYERTVAQVVAMVEHPAMPVDLPLDVRGTAFQQRVWRALLAIPAGETLSYAEIARRIGAPKSVTAVTQACAANNLAVAIPCHRVVRNDGGYRGYSWGIARKRQLLACEAQDGETPAPS
ncbi:bifunctional DNA-binding transcriptional regulator/O6-methylguanine-DNA methyltransferase Ada [Sphingobium sp.]|uniref:bifunctional DNA-binding transcriptional regulator/O6-methylguanine-DNA methyltransferase Ada n=1 Tax=Sphingobium sp. TaxID=1912891 RepID=UPI003B3A4AA9